MGGSNSQVYTLKQVGDWYREEKKKNPDLKPEDVKVGACWGDGDRPEFFIDFPKGQ